MAHCNKSTTIEDFTTGILVDSRPGRIDHEDSGKDLELDHVGFMLFRIECGLSFAASSSAISKFKKLFSQLKSPFCFPVFVLVHWYPALIACQGIKQSQCFYSEQAPSFKRMLLFLHVSMKSWGEYCVSRQKSRTVVSFKWLLNTRSLVRNHHVLDNSLLASDVSVFLL